MTINVTHHGNDQMGAPTVHKGLLGDCPAPECQDRVTQAQEKWGAYCPHGLRIVEKDPEKTGPAGLPVERIVHPWPCAADGCTREEFERKEAEMENEYWASLMDEVRQ
ncbi:MULTISPECIES: hypothetical protein [Streptomyces]|uniref:hypothetical protein n=1 Tax=Streptomyces TaxID=1883 RepID=UPI0004CD9E15|nr:MULTISPECIES: hypothetical protein [Streptomyces]KOT57071.1 hypothetical protein ADK43_21810 [Streptomyces rimosus subsp. rimosus]